MLQITQVDIFTLSKDEDVWSVEGEVTFEDDLISAFEANYLPDEEDFDEISMELELSGIDEHALKDMILEAMEEYEE